MPQEAYAPLIIDPDRMLTETIRLEGFKAISRRHAEVIQNARLIQKTELSKRYRLYVRWQFPAPAPGPDQFGFRIGKTLDHLQV